MADMQHEAVLAVNQALYDAIETGDIDLMQSIWSTQSDTICVHPGAEPVRGTSAILRSWAVVMANTGYIQFFLTDMKVDFLPDGASDPKVAHVTCTENVLSGEGVESVQSFAGGKAVASNLFVREDDRWKMTSHHSSPVAIAEEP